MVSAPGPGTAARCFAGQLICIWINYLLKHPVETTTTTTTTTVAVRCDTPEPSVAPNWFLWVARVVLSFFAGGLVAPVTFASWAISAGGLASLAAGSGVAAWVWRVVIGKGLRRGAPGSPFSPVIEGAILPYGDVQGRSYSAEVEWW